jgi:hypothetical protein
VKEVTPKQWADALMSGDYQQGIDAMCRQGDFDVVNGLEFCCLGVLSDLVVPQANWEDQELFEEGFDTAELPGPVLDAAPYMEEKQGFSPTDTFATLNDHGHSFEDIAHLILEWTDHDFDIGFLERESHAMRERMRAKNIAMYQKEPRFEDNK